MLSLNHFAAIRQDCQDGLTIHQIADQFGRSTKTSIKALADPESQPYKRVEPRVAPVFDAWTQTIGVGFGTPRDVRESVTV